MPEIVVTAQAPTPPSFPDLADLASIQISQVNSGNNLNGANPNGSPVLGVVSGFSNNQEKNDDDKMRGGKQKNRDQSIKRYPKEFQRWYHRQVKPDAHPGRNATEEELRDGFKEWVILNKPVAVVRVTVGIAASLGIL